MISEENYRTVCRGQKRTTTSRYKIYCYNGKGMKQVYNYWMPDSDNHFHRMITKRIKNGGPAEYQDDVEQNLSFNQTDFDLAIDVGANVGLWAKPLSQHFKQVIAYEPMSQVYECLHLNIKDLPVQVNEYALGNVNSTVQMTYDSDNTGNSFISEVGVGNIEVKRLEKNLEKY